MDHKLAHRWRVFSINEEIDPPRFVPRGVMDLRKMSEAGVLTGGEYEEALTTKQYEIKGVATTFGGVVQLVLENVEKPGEHWKGFLIYEKGNALKVGGTRIVPESERLNVDQNEEPWIITKP